MTRSMYEDEIVSDRPARVGIWLYFWLLLLEGVLRKWIFPQWSDAIFIIRDPLVIVVYLLAIRIGAFPRRPAMVAIWIMAVLSLGFSIATDSPFVVTVFGLRTNYLHLPLIFVMAKVMNRDDVLQFGRWFILTSIPILVLMIVQFNSPAESWINVGVGGTELGQLRGAMGHIRPPGPFSFIAGIVSYYAFVAAFVAYGWIQRGAWHWLLTSVGSIVVVSVVPVSISRSLLFAFVVVGFFAAPAVIRDFRRIRLYVGPLVAGLSLFLLEADSVYVRVFATRWEEASLGGGGNFYGNVVLRILDEFILPFRVAGDAPLLGHGIGLGTVAGARLATGKYMFLLAESELARIVLELGPFLGFAFIAWRVWLAGTLVLGSWKKLLDFGDPLPWLITGATFLAVIWGQWGPATTLGFAVFGAGLALAAQNEPVVAATTDDNDGDAQFEHAADETRLK